MLRQKAQKAQKKSNIKQTKHGKKSPLKQQKRGHQGMTVLQALTGATNTKPIPLNQVYPGAAGPNEYELGVEKNDVSPPKISKLRNGMTVITQDSMVPITHISLSVDMGSRYENAENHENGLSHFMERSLLRSTTNRVTGTLIRDFAKLGAELIASSSRENLMLSATTPSRINPTLGAMADIVKNAAYELRDLTQDRGYYVQESHQRTRSYDVIVNDLLHQAAFGNKGLGQSMFMHEHSVHQLQPKHLKNWHNTFMVANRMTLSAVGVDHESFVALADEMFGGIARKTVDVENVPTEYIGGNIRVSDPEYNGPTHIALAWDAPSIKASNMVAANVLQSVLGGGASFSSGGPGKGMYTRLYRNILGQHNWVNSVESFLNSYTDAGLMGIYATVPAQATGDYVDELLNEVSSLPKTLVDDEVNRAKNLLKTQLLKHIGDSHTRSEEMARNIQIFGAYKFPNFLEQIDSITTKDVAKVAEEIFLNKDKPITVATLGDSSQLPRDISL